MNPTMSASAAEVSPSCGAEKKPSLEVPRLTNGTLLSWSFLLQYLHTHYTTDSYIVYLFFVPGYTHSFEISIPASRCLNFEVVRVIPSPLLSSLVRLPLEAGDLDERPAQTFNHALSTDIFPWILLRHSPLEGAASGHTKSSPLL